MLEGLVGGIILLVIYLMVKTGDFSQALPLISLYAFAGTLPAIQQIYHAVAQIRFIDPSFDILISDLKKDVKKQSKRRHHPVTLKTL